MNCLKNSNYSNRTIRYVSADKLLIKLIPCSYDAGPEIEQIIQNFILLVLAKKTNIVLWAEYFFGAIFSSRKYIKTYLVQSQSHFHHFRAPKDINEIYQKMLNKLNIIFVLFFNRPFLLAGRLPVEEEEIPIPNSMDIICSSEMTVAECSKGKFDRVRCRLHDIGH